MMCMMHTLFNRAFSPAFDRAIPEFLNIAGHLAMRKRDFGTSTCHQGLGSDTRLFQKDSGSIFDIEEDADLTPHISRLSLFLVGAS